VIIRNILDWLRCMLAICDLLSHMNTIYDLRLQFYTGIGTNPLGQRDGSPRLLISVVQTGAANFHSSRSSVIFKRPIGPGSRPTTSQKM
jgi:hypothetical protein